MKYNAIVLTLIALGGITSASAQIDPQPVYTLSSTDGTPLVEVINRPMNQGYIIRTHAEGARAEVLGYTDSGAFDPKQPDARIMQLLRGYAQGLDQVQHDPAVRQLAQEQAQLAQARRAQQRTQAVEPLLGNIAWGQDYPFNLYAPFINGYQAPSGCVATATSQVMYYHRWPLEGKGSNTKVNLETGEELYANFEHPYLWDEMLPQYDQNSPTSACQAVGQLLYDVAIGFGLDYQQYQTGGSFQGPSMIQNFGYDRGIRVMYGNYASTADYEQVLRQELDARRPLLMSGGGASGGHAFVCDGYNAEGYFHYNFGWNGSGNGYFLSNATGYDSSPGFHYGIQPDAGGQAAVSVFSLKDFEWVSDRTIQSMIFAEVCDGSHYDFDFGFRVENKKTGAVKYYKSYTYEDVRATYFEGAEFDVDLPDGSYAVSPAVRLSTDSQWTEVYHHPLYQNSIDLKVQGGVYTFENNGYGTTLDEGKVLIDGICYLLDDETLEAEMTYRNQRYKSYSGYVVVPDVVSYQGQSYRVTRIGASALAVCTDLTTVTIGANVKSIGVGAFDQSSVREVRFAPDSQLEEIEGWGFNACSNLEKIELPTSLKSIGMCAFQSCWALAEIDLPASLYDLTAFWYGIQIGAYAFESCFSLRDVHVHWGSPLPIEDIFSGIELADIRLWVPQGSASIYQVLDDWRQMQIIEDPNDIPADQDEGEIDADVYLIDGVYYRLYSALGTAHVERRNVSCSGYSGDVVIPAQITYAGKTYKVTNFCMYAMSNSIKLTSVTIEAPDIVIGDEAMSNCALLKSVTLRGSGSLSEVRSYAFNGCQSLTQVDLKGATLLGMCSFCDCRSLQQIELPISLYNPEGGDNENIQYGCFMGCQGLQCVTVCWPQGRSLAADEVFRGVDVSKVKLQVPQGTADSFRSCTPWCDFLIEEVEMGIQSVTVDPAPCVMYDLMGRRVDRLHGRGFVIKAAR